MYIIGVFLVTNEVEVIPEIWLEDRLTSVKNSTECWWPPYKSSSKAVINKEEVGSSWSKYTVRVLGRYETFDEARKKLPKATDTSNLDTDDGDDNIKRRRRKNRIFEDDSDSDETILPQPPKFKKKKINSPITISTSPINISTPKTNSIQHTIEYESTTPTTSKYQTRDNLHRGWNEEAEMSLSKITDPVVTCIRRDVIDIKLKLNGLIESFEEFKQKVLCNSNILTNNDVEDNSISNEITNKFPITEENMITIENLLEDQKVKSALTNYFKKYGGRDVKNATFKILRMVFTNELASAYSWLGAKKKKVFSTLKIFEAISDAIRSQFRETTVEEISLHVKTWLRNAPTRVLLKNKTN